MTDSGSTATPVDRVVTPFSADVYELMMRQSGPSYVVADGWSIAWVESQPGWQVFYRGIDANYRIGVARGYELPAVAFSTFQRAWNWVSELSLAEIHAITVQSV